MVDLKDIMLTVHSLRKPLPPAILAMFPPSMLRKKKRSVKFKNLPSIRDLNNYRSDLSKSIPTAVVAAVAASIKAALHDPYGDGDQTPLDGAARAPLRSARTSSIDIHQSVLRDFRGSPLHGLAYRGDYEGLQFVITRAKAVGGHQLVWELMEERCSMLRLNAFACGVLGSRYARPMINNGCPSEREMPGRWEDCLALLVAYGANCTARDITGYPVMALAASGGVAESTNCRLALLLAKAGTDLNVRTRFGEPMLLLALLEVLGSLDVPSVMLTRGTKQKLELYELLVGFGADPDIQDSNGLTPRAAANSISEHRAAILEAVRQSALDEKRCASCSKALASMRCKNCFAVFYCGKECQLRDWTNHKQKCSQIWQEFGVDVDTDNKVMRSTTPNPGLALLRGKSSDVGKVFAVRICPNGTGSRERKDGLKWQIKPSSVEKGYRYFFGNGQEVGDAVFPCISDASENFFISIPQSVNEGGTSPHLHNLLLRLSQAETGEFAPDGRFYPARWQPPVVEGGAVTVLRICHAKVIASPAYFQRASKVPILN